MQGLSPGARTLISDLDIRILQAAYGYTVVNPFQGGDNFFTDLNRTTGFLSVTDAPGNHNDEITIRRDDGDSMGIHWHRTD
jgi:hypothetical protein